MPHGEPPVGELFTEEETAARVNGSESVDWRILWIKGMSCVNTQVNSRALGNQGILLGQVM